VVAKGLAVGKEGLGLLSGRAGYLSPNASHLPAPPAANTVDGDAISPGITPRFDWSTSNVKATAVPAAC
jgi:hypothetical protein